MGSVETFSSRLSTDNPFFIEAIDEDLAVIVREQKQNVELPRLQNCQDHAELKPVIVVAVIVAVCQVHARGRQVNLGI